MLRIVDQLDFGFKNDNTGSFRSHQSARDVEAAFRQKFVEVVPGDAPRNLWIARAYASSIAIANGFQFAVNFSLTSAGPDDRKQLRFAGGAHLHLRAVIKKDGKFFHVIHGLAAQK